MGIYIRSAKSISPQDTFQGNIPEEIKIYSPFLKNILPDFKNYFPPVEQRRMNALIKVSIVCALETVKESGIEKPDAIITGTGLGCVADTEKFLHSILDSNEGLLTPTAFIQSTHNIVGALIAIALKCTGYNVLYAHKTLSFDSALLDAFIQLKGENFRTILLGGFDEITQENFNLKKQINLFKSESTNADILNSKTPGSIAGEGSAFFVLTNVENKENLAKIRSVNLKARTNDFEDTRKWLGKCLEKENLSFKDIDVLITGINGDYENDSLFSKISGLFNESTCVYYKHLCGEYDTASSFAMWMACKALQNNYIPNHSIITNSGRDFKNIAVYNQNNLSDHSLILLTRAD